SPLASASTLVRLSEWLIAFFITSDPLEQTMMHWATGVPINTNIRFHAFVKATPRLPYPGTILAFTAQNPNRIPSRRPGLSICHPLGLLGWCVRHSAAPDAGAPFPV